MAAAAAGGRVVSGARAGGPILDPVLPGWAELLSLLPPPPPGCLCATTHLSANRLFSGLTMLATAIGRCISMGGRAGRAIHRPLDVGCGGVGGR